jgi:hypothetical protein
MGLIASLAQKLCCSCSACRSAYWGCKFPTYTNSKKRKLRRQWKPLPTIIEEKEPLWNWVPWNSFTTNDERNIVNGVLHVMFLFCVPGVTLPFLNTHTTALTHCPFKINLSQPWHIAFLKIYTSQPWHIALSKYAHNGSDTLLFLNTHITARNVAL